ncbi:MAG: alpha/beta hydrolase [Rhodobacterales bacterium]|nr:alpha/beta hydrolase [Rhodobacterales bacterium]
MGFPDVPAHARIDVKAAPQGARVVTVRDQDGRDRHGALVSADPIDQLRQAIVKTAKALAAEGAMPPHLAAMTWRVRDRAPFQDRLREAELRLREVVGGNLPVLEIKAVRGLDDGVAVLVDAQAVVPPPPDDPDALVDGRLTAAELNRQYSARAAVPNHLEIFVDWRDRGRAFKAAAEGRDRLRADIPYGKRPAETIDLFLPEGNRPGPLHLFIHGGYWQAMDKDDHCHLMGALLDTGAAAAVINYDLCPQVTMDRIVKQTRAACVHLWRHGAELGFDPARIQLAGHSAGGHLAAMMAATDWPALDAGLPADLVKSVVMVSGLFELDPLRFTGMNRALGLDAKAAARNSPVRLDPSHPMPMVCAVGGLESAEFQRQSRILAERWSALGSPVNLITLDGRNHFTVIEDLNDPSSPLFTAAARLLHG